MKKAFIGIDNGVTGSIGIIEVDGAVIKSAFISTPVKNCRNYTKEEQYLNRIDWKTLVDNLPKGGMVYVERPMINPKAFKASSSALRALEATIIVLEMLGYEHNKTYFFVDSKDWQKEFISSAVIGHDEMKEASKQVGLKLFPSNGGFINKHKDADGLLLAECNYRRWQVEEKEQG
jgi:hypothetical protein